MFGEKVTRKIQNQSSLNWDRTFHRFLLFKDSACCHRHPPSSRLSSCTHLGIRGSCHVLTPVCVCKKYTCPCTVVLCSVEREERLFLITILKKKKKTEWRGCSKPLAYYLSVRAGGKHLSHSTVLSLNTAFTDLLPTQSSFRNPQIQAPVCFRSIFIFRFWDSPSPQTGFLYS